MTLRIIPLGGLGEIGLNMMVFEYGESMFVVDAGLMFPEDYMLGIDHVIPDMSYLKEKRSKIAGIVLTHGHEDHIGAIPYLLKDVDSPVFGTPFTIGLVSHKLDEFNIRPRGRLHEINPGEKLKIGDFELQFIRVSHSVVDGVGLAIGTPLGRIIHTGDFKISQTPIKGMGTDAKAFETFGDQGVLALLSDSTNVEREGRTISAVEIGKTLAKITQGSKGRIVIALFASNIARIQQIVNIARERQRKVVFNGRSIEVSLEIAKRLGYIDIPPAMEIDIGEIDTYPDDEIVIVTTGSQGEPMSALARMAAGSHRQIKVKKGDTVILSSKFIPGNEKAITHIINRLYKLGANVIYEKISAIHVSGHAFRDELKEMIRMTRPKYFIPIHGEYRHLILHARLAEETGIPPSNILLAEDGQIIEFDASGARIQGEVVTGRILVDGKGIGDVGRSVLKERRMLSEEGMVVVKMAFDEETGTIIYGPEIDSRGFVFETETGYLLEDAVCVILEIVEEVSPEQINRVKIIRERVQKALRQYFYFTIGRRPVILPFIIEV